MTNWNEESVSETLDRMRKDRLHNSMILDRIERIAEERNLTFCEAAKIYNEKLKPINNMKQ